jgi:hypothetical protein
MNDDETGISEIGALFSSRDGYKVKRTVSGERAFFCMLGEAVGIP